MYSTVLCMIGNLILLWFVSTEKLVEDYSCSWCAALLDPYLILALIIWLAVVTLLLIATVIYFCRRKQRQPVHYSNANGHASSRDDLWKKYDNAGFENGEPTYAVVAEGKTAF